jgi:hypothetical protein
VLLAGTARGRLLKLRNAFGKRVAFLGFEVHTMGEGFNFYFYVVERFAYLGKVFADGNEFASTKAGREKRGGR